MSKEPEHPHENQPSDATIALFLQEQDCDQLTDVLVAALDEAYRILAQDIRMDTFH